MAAKRRKEMPEEARSPPEGRASPFPDEVLEHVLVFVKSHKDRSAVSLVCKEWYTAERWSRTHVFIGNCYSVSPEILVRRFPNIRSVTLKGKPRFSDFNLVPPNWGADIHPWLVAFASAYPFLEELRLKRMTVTDESLDFLAQSFPGFKALSLVSCDGFSTEGLASIASYCRNLTELDIQENGIEDLSGSWLNCFPEGFTSLEVLNFANLGTEVNFDALERLVGSCKSLRVLKLNKNVSLEQLQRLLVRAPNLRELGTGSFSQEYSPRVYAEVENVLDTVEDKGLEAVGSSCHLLEELRVFPADPFDQDINLDEGISGVTEAGFIAVSEGCRNLHYVLYFCRQMTNAAVAAVVRNCPNFTHFRLCIMNPRQPDYVTREPMDDAFGSVVKSCTQLQRLAVSGLLTDKTFEYIGTYAKNLETLSVAFAGRSDRGMQYVMEGCPKLRKLEIRDCPFGNAALLSGLERYESMRSLWMSACNVTMNACQLLAREMPRLNVEVIKEDESDDIQAEKVLRFLESWLPISCQICYIDCGF
ncbi:hypothetical protein Taro_015745 [Colocasia esculenta]|uniref:F-box domain-containing protein n=1 Tax=Colocasia esculenta TaxID=4460 RepID=A0A843UM11_COLES|nr:hypothetical protein [Colocasia esculenta]